MSVDWAARSRAELFRWFGRGLDDLSEAAQTAAYPGFMGAVYKQAVDIGWATMARVPAPPIPDHWNVTERQRRTLNREHAKDPWFVFTLTDEGRDIWGWINA